MKMDQCLEVEFKIPEGAVLKIGEKDYKSIILREVIGFDEEAISQPVYKENPPAMIIELISRCISEVPGAERLPNKKEIKNLPIGVLDLIVLEIRKVSVGEEIPFKAKCPKEECHNEDDVMVLASDIVLKPGDFKDKTIMLQRGVITAENKKLKKAIIKAPDGFVQEQFARYKDLFKFGELNTDLIHACVVSIDGVSVDKTVISNMTRMDRKLLSKEIQKFPGPDITAKVVCSKCGNAYETAFNVFDFLA